MKTSNKTKFLVSLLTIILFLIGAASCATYKENAKTIGGAVGVSARDGAENQVRDEVPENHQEQIYRNEVN